MTLHFYEQLILGVWRPRTTTLDRPNSGPNVRAIKTLDPADHGLGLNDLQLRYGQEALDHIAKTEEAAKALHDTADVMRGERPPPFPSQPAPRVIKVLPGETPLNEDLNHPLLDAFNAGVTARETGSSSPYSGHSLEHCLHAVGWVQRDLRLALDAAKAAPAQPPLTPRGPFGEPIAEPRAPRPFIAQMNELIARLGLDLKPIHPSDPMGETLAPVLINMADRIISLEQAADNDPGWAEKIVPPMVTTLPDRLRPRVEAVAARHTFDGYGWQYIDSGSGSDWERRAVTHVDCEWLYEAPTVDWKGPAQDLAIAGRHAMTPDTPADGEALAEAIAWQYRIKIDGAWSSWRLSPHYRSPSKAEEQRPLFLAIPRPAEPARHDPMHGLRNAAGQNQEIDIALAAYSRGGALHRSFPDASDGRQMPPMGYDLMAAGLSSEDARFTAIQLAQNGLALVPAEPAQAAQVDVAAKLAKLREAFCLASPGSDEGFAAWLEGFDAAVAIITQDAALTKIARLGQEWDATAQAGVDWEQRRWEAMLAAALEGAVGVCDKQAEYRAEQMKNDTDAGREQIQRWLAGRTQSRLIGEAIRALIPAPANAALEAALAQREREVWEKAAKMVDPPLMHRKGRIGIWRKRRADLAAALRAKAAP